MGVVGVIVVLVLGGVGYFMMGSNSGGLKVASFNGEVFGDAKISNVGVDYYVDLVSDYDLFFLLEIKGFIFRRKVGRSLEVVLV